MAQPFVFWIYLLCMIALVVLYTLLSSDTHIAAYLLILAFIILIASKIIFFLRNVLNQQETHSRETPHEEQLNFRNGLSKHFHFGQKQKESKNIASPYDLLRGAQEIPQDEQAMKFGLHNNDRRISTQNEIGKINRTKKPVYKNNSKPNLTSTDEIFGTIRLWELDNFDQIKIAQQQFQRLKIKASDAKDLITKLRSFLRAQFEEYDREQTAKFNQITRLTNLLFGLQSLQSRNCFMKKIQHILHQYQKTGQLLRMSTMKFNDSIPKKDFIEKLQQIKVMMNSMIFPRFLESSSKFDLLQFYIWVLQNKILSQCRISLFQTKQKIQPSTVINPHEQTIFYISPQNFCYCSPYQHAHCVNLQETMLIVILRSSDYASNPSLLDRLLT